jgi:site-specific DNA-methyltransferase (adenine-specific)
MNPIREEWISRDGQHRILWGDCLEILPTLDTSEVAAVLADPPYGMDNDNDYSRFTEGPNGHGAATTRTYPPTVGDDEPFDPTPFMGFDRVILWGANHFASRLPVGTTLVWIKRFDGGYGSFLSDAEVGWMKGGHGVYCHRDTSMYSRPEKRQHQNEKPVGLLRWCLDKLKTQPGDLILDPFAGSCTVAVACARTGRRSISIEIEERYFRIGIERMEREAARFPLLTPRSVQKELTL